jgi:hypothetical protein
VSEPVKVLPMAKLLRLAREKEERERAEKEASETGLPTREQEKTNTTTHEQNLDSHQTKTAETIPSKTIAGETIVKETIPHSTIPSETIVSENMVDIPLDDSISAGKEAATSPKKKSGKKNKTAQIPIPPQTIVPQTTVDSNKGYYPFYNDISDRLIPELQLDPYQQAVLLRLYRLSRGWKSEECEVGLGTLAKYCVMSRSQVQRSVAKLIEKGLLESLGSSKKGGKEGNRYKVLPGLNTIPRQTIPDETIPPETTPDDTIVSEGGTSIRQNTVVSQGIVPRGTNKNSNKDLKNNTHTEPIGGVGSKFSLEECRRYAEHLQKTGQGINNPGGYATAIYRSGEFDVQIEAFLNPPTSVDASNCPACGGSGYFYPEGVDKGVKICKHEMLKGG